MFIGGALGVLILCLMSTAADRWLFSGLLLILGVSMASTLYDPCFALLMQRLKTQGTGATATVTLIAGLATLVTFPLVLVLSDYLDWREIILVFGVIAAVALLLLPKEDRRARGFRKVNEAQPFKVTKAPLIIGSAFGLIMMGHAIFLFMLPVTLGLGKEAGKIGVLAVAILGPSQILGRLAWKILGGRWAPQPSAIALFVLFCVPPVILVLAGSNIALIYLALIMQGACYGVHTILRPVLSHQYLLTEHLGQGFGIIATIGLLLMAVGPALGGVVWSISDFSGLMTCVLFINVIALFLVTVVSRIGSVRDSL